MYELGYGNDMYSLTPNQITLVMQILYSTEVMYFVVVTLTKLSILFFYLRVFPFAAFPTLRVAIYWTMAVTVAWGISLAMPLVFQCWPISYFWEAWTMPLPHSGTCINAGTYGWFNGASSIALDLWLIALPFPELSRLTLPWRKKLQVLAMFGLGLL